MYLYLASPYSHDNWNIMQARYAQARDLVAHLLQQNITVFSPIVHCHELAKVKGMPTDHEFWMTYNFRMLAPARKLLVLMLEGWESSKGVASEIQYARVHGKPVLLRRPLEIVNNIYSAEEYFA